MSTPLLVWGSTPLISEDSTGQDWWIETSADGTTWGNPEAVVTAIKSHLQDGSLAQVTSYENRQATLRVRVRAYDYEGLAQGEAALVSETSVPGYNTLTWAPHDTLAKPTVFDVVYAVPSFDFNDLDEVKRSANTVISRSFSLTLECLPFGRDENLTLVEATAAPVAPGDTPPAPTFSTIDDGSNITGWDVQTTGPYPVLVPKGAASGKIYGDNANSVESILFVRNSPSFDLTTDRLMVVDFAYLQNDGKSTPPTLTVNVGTSGPVVAATLIQVATFPAGGAGYYRATYQMPASTVQVQARISLLFSNVAPFTRVSIDAISRTNSLPAVGATNYQRLRSLTVGGSARTPANLRLSSGPGLGEVALIYTRSSIAGALQPPLRPWAPPTPFADANLLSGGYSQNAFGAKVPAMLVQPATYNLVAMVRGTGQKTITYTAEMLMPNGIPANGFFSLSEDVPVTLDGTWQVVDLGLVTLPPVAVSSDSTLGVGITLICNGVDFDEVWIFDVDHGVLSTVETYLLSTLEIRTPDIDNPEPSYWGGYGASTSFGPGLVRVDHQALAGEHVFTPGPMDIFTACRANALEVTASYYRRHFTHATERD